MDYRLAIGVAFVIQYQIKPCGTPAQSLKSHIQVLSPQAIEGAPGP